ncbi:MAG: hypothetical protein KGO53_06095 [Alphaproteobacteria bacterium]|nr:hypothetical protein [Alphaproteobacteria bacterium]
MNEHSELPFMNTKDMQNLPPFMMFAMWPWLMASTMMAQTMSFWTMAARGGLGKSWPLGDSFDHINDAPAEDLMEHEHVAPEKFTAKAKDKH